MNNVISLIFLVLSGLASHLSFAHNVMPPPDAEAVATGSDTLRILTYNTHGLPGWITGNHTRERLESIILEATRYDVVLLQEHFYFADIVEDEPVFSKRVRGVASRGWLPGLPGSGLTSMTVGREVIQVKSEAFGVCSGWIRRSSDCLANKGWLMIRIRLANGIEIDFWNTHLDAGSAGKDHRTRHEQLKILQRAVRRFSGYRPVVLGGDLNLNWGSATDRVLLTDFSESLGLEVAMMAEESTGWQPIDYILIRSGYGTVLSLHSGGVDSRFVRDGRPLSDHPAIYVNLEIRRDKTPYHSMFRQQP